MNTLNRKGLCFASALVTATLTCMPASAAAEERAPVSASGEISLAATSLANVASPAAFAAPAHAAWLAQGASFAVGAETSVSTPVAFSSSAPALDSSVEAASGESVADFNALPEAPTPVRVETPAFMYQASNTGTAPHYALNIPSGWSAQPLSAGDKVVLGLRNLYNPVALAGTIISAGYSHITDGQPNYGVDGTAFGKRFGAGVARSASQDIFTNSILAPILHEDPRYYVEGSNYSFVHRVLYAVTRPIIGRTDGGHTTVNAAMLIGYAGAAALTPAYYPQVNHNFHDVAATFGGSIGGAALGFGVTEFSDQLLKAIHLKK